MSTSALVLLLAAFPAQGDRSTIAFTNAVIETAGKAGRIESGTVVVRGGKVEAVGADVKPPDDAQVIDLHGQTIMPGMIDPFREVTIAGGTGDSAPRTVVVGGRTITVPGRPGGGTAGFTRVADNFYPYDSGYRSLLRSGLTGLNLVTAGHCQAAVVRVTPANPDGMLINPDGLLFTPVTNDSTSLDTVRNGLEMVDRVRKGGEATLPPTTPSGDQPSTPGSGRPGGGGRRPGGFGPRPFGGGGGTASLKTWEDTFDGKAPLFVNAANAAAVVHLLKALEPYKDVKLVLTAPGPVLYETLEHLPKRGVRVVLRPGLSLLPNTRDRIDVACLLHQAGVEFAFTQPASQADLLATQDSPLFPVAYSVRCGLPRKAALEALTARPAALLGLDKTHGTIEAGKSADLLIFTGDPLDPESQLARVLIEGRIVYEN
jgi:hypothetical protein